MSKLRRIPVWINDEVINSLSAGAERLFTRIYMVADNYGRMHYDAPMVRYYCLNGTGENDENINIYLQELEKNNLIFKYQVGCRNFLVITIWHRKGRGAFKYPAPEGQPGSWMPCFQENEDGEISWFGELAANSPQDAASCGEPPSPGFPPTPF